MWRHKTAQKLANFVQLASGPDNPCLQQSHLGAVVPNVASQWNPLGDLILLMPGSPLWRFCCSLVWGVAWMLGFLKLLRCFQCEAKAEKHCFWMSDGIWPKMLMRVLRRCQDWRMSRLEGETIAWFPAELESHSLVQDGEAPGGPDHFKSAF